MAPARASRWHNRSAMTDPLHPTALSWAALLGKWLEFAQASLALPRDEDGRRWADSVAPAITLQAVTFALSELEHAEASERLLGWDRSDLLVSDATETLDDLWGPGLPPDLVALAAAAEDQLADSISRFTPTLIVDSAMVMPLLDPVDPVGGHAAVAHGTPVMPGTPVAWWTQVDLDHLRSRPLPGVLELWLDPVQVWRCRDEQDRFVEDVVLDLDEVPEQAVPLLVPRVIEGLPLSDPLPPARDVEAFHRQHLEVSRWPIRRALRP